MFPLALFVSPNPFPDVGLGEGASANFTFELTVFNSGQNPDLALVVSVQPSSAQNLSISHCLENGQVNLSGFNQECKDGEFNADDGEYYANVTSASSVMLRIQAVYIGSITEPVPIEWLFFAEGTEIP
ncbi:MAG: hypothetical protein ACE5IJ_05245 [Thermoplasmata archaeon]